MYTNFSPCFYLWNRSSNWEYDVSREYINILYCNKRATRVQFPDKKTVCHTIEHDTRHFCQYCLRVIRFSDDMELKITVGWTRAAILSAWRNAIDGRRINVRVSIRRFRDDFLSLHEVYARSQHVFTISGIENRLPDTSFTSRVRSKANVHWETCGNLVEEKKKVCKNFT